MISVLMCTYNRERFLRRAIDSVLNQTYKDIEFIIVDDGSTDQTEELVKSYDDTRIHYRKMERNSFYCYAANCGLTHCKGDYVAFMNSDDVWLPEKLEKQLMYLEAYPEYGACFTEVTLIDDQEEDITEECQEISGLFARHCGSQKEYIQSLLKYGNSLCHPSALVRKSLLDKIGGFNLMFCQLADYDLWIRIVTETPIYTLRERLIQFRWDKNAKDQISGATTEKNRRVFNEQVLIRKHMIERLSDEKFKEFFNDWFKNKESSSHLELEFERAFLLLECMGEAPELKVLGIEKLEQVMRIPGAMEVLRNHFKMDIFEIYQWNKSHMYYTPWVEQELQDLKCRMEAQENLIIQKEQKEQSLEAAINHQNALIELKEQHIVNLEQHIADLENHSQGLSRQIVEKEQLIETYENSTSWKVTKPLRNLMRMVKNK